MTLLSLLEKADRPSHFDLLVRGNKGAPLTFPPELVFQILFNNQTPVHPKVPLVCRALNAFHVEGLKKYLKIRVLDALPKLETANGFLLIKGTSKKGEQLRKLFLDIESIPGPQDAVSMRRNEQSMKKIYRATHKMKLAMGELLEELNPQPPSLLESLSGAFKSFFFPPSLSLYSLVGIVPEINLFEILFVEDSETKFRIYDIEFNEEAIENGSFSDWQMKEILEAVDIRQREWILVHPKIVELERKMGRPLSRKLP